MEYARCDKRGRGDVPNLARTLLALLRLLLLLQLLLWVSRVGLERLWLRVARIGITVCRVMNLGVHSAPRLMNVHGERKEMRLIAVRAVLTLVNVGRVTRELMVGAVLGGVLVVVARLIGHVWAIALEEMGARGEGERGRGGLL